MSRLVACQPGPPTDFIEATRTFVQITWVYMHYMVPHLRDGMTNLTNIFLIYLCKCWAENLGIWYRLVLSRDGSFQGIDRANDVRLWTRFVAEPWRAVVNTVMNAWFQASTATWMRYALFWDVTQRTVVIPHRRFGTNYWFHLQE